MLLSTLQTLTHFLALLMHYLSGFLSQTSGRYSYILSSPLKKKIYQILWAQHLSVSKSLFSIIANILGFVTLHFCFLKNIK